MTTTLESGQAHEPSRLTPKQFWLLAAQWGSFIASGDPGAVMYGFDERGMVQSEEHREACIAWIEGECRKAADANIAAGEGGAELHRELDTLVAYLRTAKVSQDKPSVEHMDDFTRAYIKAALWSSMDDNGDPLDDNYTPEHLAEETLIRMVADCARFRAAHLRDIVGPNYARPLKGETQEAMAGHDFWLTRNGQSVGFWDGDWSEPMARRMTSAAKAFGEYDLYVGDDGQIYGSGGNPAPERAPASTPTL